MAAPPLCLVSSHRLGRRYGSARCAPCPRDSAEPRALDGPVHPGGRFDRWRKRIRFWRHLARLVEIEPQLVVDIGFTLQEAEEGIEKSFWRL
jgi:uncharacterized protein YjiS (DUF1127 family)